MRHRATSWGSLCLGLVLLAAPSRAQNAPLPSSAIRIDDAFDALVDDAFGQALTSANVPGAIFGAVDGRGGASRLVLKSYGVADLATKVPTSPQTTLFQVASLTKALTAVCVLQLAEQGKLDLDADVNRWLDGWSLAPPPGSVVTLSNLLTHTAGFDDRNIGRAYRDGSTPPELGALLARTAPPFAFAPGEVCSYSNWGFTLAGYVVERASGQSLAGYAAEHVFAPLGMEHSWLGLSYEWRGPRPIGYELHGDENVPEPLFRDVGAGAGMWITTAEDYCRFLAALLGGGAFEGPNRATSRILAPESVERLLAQHFTHDARLAGCAYGFFERFHEGHRVLEHSGRWPGFVSQVCLLPDEHVGFFFSLNSGAGSRVRLSLVDALLEAWLGAPRPSSAAELPGEPDARLLGAWRSTAYSRATIERLMSLFDQFELSASGDGRLLLWGDTLKRVAPDAFEPVDGALYLAPGPVVFDLAQDPARFYVARNSYERVPWAETLRVQIVWASAMVAAFLWAVLVWPLGAWIARRGGRVVDERVRRAQRWALAASACALVFLAGAALAVRNASGANGGEFAFGVPLAVRGLLFLPFVTLLLALGAFVASLRVFRSASGTRFGRWQLGLVTLAHGLFLAWLGLWNLLGWRW